MQHDLAAREREPKLARSLVAGVLAEEHVHLVEEQDHAALGARELRLELTDSLGERPAHPRAREHAGGLDAHEDLVLEAGDVVAVRDAHGEPAHDARLADAGSADEACVVRVPLGEDIERSLDLGVAPDHRVELPARGHLREVLSELTEQRKLLRIQRKPIHPSLGGLGRLLHRNGHGLLALALRVP